MLSKVPSSGKSPVSNTRPTQSPNETKPQDESRLKTKELGSDALRGELDIEYSSDENDDKVPPRRVMSAVPWAKADSLNPAMKKLDLGAIGAAATNPPETVLKRRFSR